MSNPTQAPTQKLAEWHQKAEDHHWIMSPTSCQKLYDIAQALADEVKRLEEQRKTILEAVELKDTAFSLVRDAAGQLQNELTAAKAEIAKQDELLKSWGHSLGIFVGQVCDKHAMRRQYNALKATKTEGQTPPKEGEV